MKTQVLCILIFSFAISSCSRYTRIGHTRYPVGTAASKNASESSQSIKYNPISVGKKVVPEETAIANAPSPCHETKQETEKSIDCSVSSSPVVFTPCHETLRMLPPDKTMATDTGIILKKSGVLLRIANISYVVSNLAATPAFIILIFYIVFTSGSLASIFLFDFTLALMVMNIFMTLAAIALLAWLISSIIFWVKYGRQLSIVKSFRETNKRFIFHMVTLIQYAMGLLIELALLILSAF